MQVRVDGLQHLTLHIHEKEKLIELSSDVRLVYEHKMKYLSQFWISLKIEYQSPDNKAIKPLVIFSTTYLREKTFSSMIVINNEIA